MFSARYLAGLAFFAPTLISTLWAATLIQRKRFGHLRGLARGLAFSVLATSALVFAQLLPAIAGILTRGTTVGAAVLTLLIAIVLPVGEKGRDRGAPLTPTPPRSSPSSVGLTIAVVGGLLTYEFARLSELITHLPTYIDMVGFHLPGIARVMQTGTLWQVTQFFPGFATAQYPNNGDFLILAVSLPWHDFAFARLPAIVYFGVTGVGTYALGLELGAGRATAATFGAVATAVPAVSNLAVEGMPDSITLAMTAIGCTFLIRHCREQRGEDLILAGLALGLSAGTKWYGLTADVVLLGVWGAAWLTAGRWRTMLRHVFPLLGAAAAGGGFWLIRNLIESGNPIYPKAVSLLGIHIFSGSHGDVIDQYGYTIFDYILKPGIIRHYIYPGFKEQLGLAGLVLAVGALTAVVCQLRASHVSDKPVHLRFVPWTVAAAIGVCVMYCITPGSAYGLKDLPNEGFVNIRWLVPALLLAAAASAYASQALRATRVPLSGLALELAAAAAAVWEVHAGPSVTGRGTVIGVAVSVGAALTVVSARWIGRARFMMPVAVAGGTLAAVLLPGLLAERVDRRTYGHFDPVYAWIDAHAPASHHIALTGYTDANVGVAPELPAFGPRLRNVVALVGDRVQHSVHFPSSLLAFKSELQHGRYDLLLIGMTSPAHTDVWAQELGYKLIIKSNRVALFAAPPRTVSPRARGN